MTAVARAGVRHWAMPPFSIATVSEVSEVELVDLYESVGWSAYTRQPEVLAHAVRNSSFVVAARDERGQLLGLARAISDDSTICYVQDVLRPARLAGQRHRPGTAGKHHR